MCLLNCTTVFLRHSLQSHINQMVSRFCSPSSAPPADLEIDGIPIYTRGVPSERDNDAERFARIEALMEEYRVKHEDLEAYVESVRDRARQASDAAQVRTDAARMHHTTRSGHR